MGQCTAQCKMLLFRARTVVRDSDTTELARLKKKEERGEGEKDQGRNRGEDVRKGRGGCKGEQHIEGGERGSER